MFILVDLTVKNSHKKKKNVKRLTNSKFSAFNIFLEIIAIEK